MASSKRVSAISRHLTSAVAATNAISDAIGSEEEVVNGFDHLSLFDSSAKSILTPEQMKQYDEQGFIVIKALFSPAELEVFADRFRRICSGEVDKGGMLVMRDVVLAKQNKEKKIQDETDCTKIQDFQDDEVLFQYCKNEKIIKYVRAFLGDNIRSIHTMLINKPPDLGAGSSRHPMHQDLLYFPFRPASRIVAAWTAMQKINRENGCLSVIPGTHKEGLIAHKIPEWNENVNLAYQGVAMDDNLRKRMEERVFLDMEPGDTVFFHPCLIHGSGQNRSKGFRKAISCHYASGKECFFTPIPKHNYGLIDELFGMAEKKNQAPLSLSHEEKLSFYQMVWKQKSRQIIGEEPEWWEA